jgi:hypothetical protein
VAEVVEAERSQAGTLERRPELAAHEVGRVERCADGGREDVVGVAVEARAQLRFGERGACRAEEGNEALPRLALGRLGYLGAVVGSVNMNGAGIEVDVSPTGLSVG